MSSKVFPILYTSKLTRAVTKTGNGLTKKPPAYKLISKLAWVIKQDILKRGACV